jgi:hypothetical protein
MGNLIMVYMMDMELFIKVIILSINSIENKSVKHSLFVSYNCSLALMVSKNGVTC